VAFPELPELLVGTPQQVELDGLPPLRHRWHEGDVLLWDNRVTAHYAVDDYGTAGRRVHRVTLKGEPAFGPDSFTSHPTDNPLLAIR
jgi:hypothetical protein